MFFHWQSSFIYFFLFSSWEEGDTWFRWWSVWVRFIHVSYPELWPQGYWWCDWCGISESVQGLHREPNLNAAVKFRMMTNKTILVKLWNNSATRKVVPPFCIISWWSQGGPGNQEHATNTEWPDFSVSPFLMLPVLGWKSRINFTRPHWAHFFVVGFTSPGCSGMRMSLLIKYSVLHFSMHRENWSE